MHNTDFKKICRITYYIKSGTPLYILTQNYPAHILLAHVNYDVLPPFEPYLHPPQPRGFASHGKNAVFTKESQKFQAQPWCTQS